MSTLVELFDAEEHIRQWHAQRPGYNPEMDDGEDVQHRASWRATIDNWLAAGRRMTWRSKIATRTAVDSLSPLSVLNAVARGELSPKAAQQVIQGQVSTLALLQSVAWGEISPNAAQHLLGR
jgi:hypothetical protein